MSLERRLQFITVMIAFIGPWLTFRGVDAAMGADGYSQAHAWPMMAAILLTFALVWPLLRRSQSVRAG